MLRSFPHKNGSAKQVHKIQEIEIVGQLARMVPRIYAALEDLQEDYQSIVVEVEGNIAKQSISILIEPGSTHSYFSPKIVESFSF